MVAQRVEDPHLRDQVVGSGDRPIAHQKGTLLTTNGVADLEHDVEVQLRHVGHQQLPVVDLLEYRFVDEPSRHVVFFPGAEVDGAVLGPQVVDGGGDGLTDLSGPRRIGNETAQSGHLKRPPESCRGAGT